MININQNDIIYGYRYIQDKSHLPTMVKTTYSVRLNDKYFEEIKLQSISDNSLTVDISYDNMNVVKGNMFMTNCERDNEEIKMIFISAFSDRIHEDGMSKKDVKLLEKEIEKLRR